VGLSSLRMSSNNPILIVSSRLHLKSLFDGLNTGSEGEITSLSLKYRKADKNIPVQNTQQKYKILTSLYNNFSRSK